jgi:hypothetical protein
MRRLILLLALLVAAPGETLTGTVVDAAGQPVDGARVRLRASSTVVLTDSSGRFALADATAAPGGEITAAHTGHIIGGAVLKSGVSDYRIALPAIPDGDDPTYPWVTAFPEDDQPPRTDFGREACGACHRRILAEWQASAHARSATNPRFLAFLDGASRLTSQREPVNVEGCGTCHVPMAPSDDLRKVAGVAGEGVGCDFCHKVAAARPGEGSFTGVRALDLRRPPFGRQTIFGPFDDVPRGRDAFTPVFTESRYCSACHQARDGKLAIYSEFEEWQASRYATAGVTCQSCHMRGDGRATTMSELGPGRIVRDPATLSSHRFHDSRSPDLLAGAVETAIAAERDGDVLVVSFEIANRGAGHHLPAGSPMRHMLLSIEAEAEGRPLELIEGSTLPSWAGADLGGRPGRAYAKKILTAGSAEAGHPALPWERATTAEDTRIAAGDRDRSIYRFRLNGADPVRVTAKVIIRRTFPAWAEALDLTADEIRVATHSTTIRR